MPSTRTIIPHCSLNQPIIDAFQCSECEWSYVMPGAEPYVIALPDAENACRTFDGHRCEHFKPRDAREWRSAIEEPRATQSKGGKATPAKGKQKRKKTS